MTELSRALRFLLVGGINTVFSYFCFVGLHWLEFPLSAAVVLSTVMGVMFNFVSFGTLVFDRARGAALIRFVAIYSVIATLNYLFLTLLSRLGLSPALGQAICLPILAAASYLGMRFWVYTVPLASNHLDKTP